MVRSFLNEKIFRIFKKLQYYENHLNYPLVYYVFDILELNGKNMEKLPVEERKKILKQLLKNNQTIRYCDHIDTNGIAFLEKAKSRDWKELSLRKKIACVRGYRSKEWLKIKNIQSTEVVIVGYTNQRVDVLILDRWCWLIKKARAGNTVAMLAQVFHQNYWLR
jgi:bifunctional non-homologous end joining protein LigD